jgi:hypothetical protein
MPLRVRPRAEAQRGSVSVALFGAAAERALPAPTLDTGLSDAELDALGRRPSMLGRMSSWVSGAISGLRKSDKGPQTAASALPGETSEQQPAQLTDGPAQLTDGQPAGSAEPDAESASES